MKNQRSSFNFVSLSCAALAVIAMPLQTWAIQGDYDGNGVVDLGDYQGFNAYTNGPDAEPEFGGWELLDLDFDSDVDFADFAIMQNNFTGHDLCLGGTCVECLDNSDCNDNDACTTDVCEVDNTCSNTPISGCGAHPVAIFTDPVSGFSTKDVRDVDNEIINFDLTDKSIIYVATGAEYQVGSWPVNGNLLDGGFFQVRFGTVLGEHRAYFTETGNATICNFVVTPTSFSIFATSTQVPHT
jgi:hypothetical protein